MTNTVMNVVASSMCFIGAGSEWFWAMLQFVAILISLFFIWRQLKIQNNTHLVSTLNLLNKDWNSTEMLKHRKETCEKWKTGKTDFDTGAQAIADFMEDLAIYEKEQVIPTDKMWYSFSWYIGYYWNMFKDEIPKVQNEYKDKTLWSEFPKLVKTMNDIDIGKGISDCGKSDSEMSKFYNVEIAGYACKDS